MSTYFITGANRGLGLALTQRLRSRGDSVIGACRNPDAAGDLRATGAEAVAFDALDPATIAALAVSMSGREIDVVVNGAGVDARAFGGPENFRGALDLTAEQFDGVMRVNVTAPMLLVQALIDPLRRTKGKVINISSQIGSLEVAKQMGRDAVYAASKAALNMLTIKQSQVLAADGITTICMHPGWVQTDMGGASATLTPEESAEGIVNVIDGLTHDQNGSFLRWDGTVHPW